MAALTCNCGLTVENEDGYKVKAQMWEHAIKDHAEMLKEMSADQLEQILRSHDQILAQ